MYQWIRIESPKINPYLRSTDFQQGCQHDGKKTVFPTNGPGMIGYLHTKE